MDDDDMIVVVIGDDGEVVSGDSVEICPPIAIKEEPIDDTNVMEIIATAAKYGRPIKLELDSDDAEPEEDDPTFFKALENIKEEISEIPEVNSQSCGSEDYQLGDVTYNPYTIEFLEDFPDNDDNADYKIPAGEESSDSMDSDEDNVKGGWLSNRRRMLSPERCKSFVEDLRQQYPELKRNEKALIKSLVEIMRNYKRPKPPRDYFIMNDIMFECVKCGTMTECIPAAGRHYQEKHGPRYLVCFACGVDFRSKTNLYKHEKRCSAPDAVVVLKARALFLGRKGRSRPFLPDLSTVPVLKPKAKRFNCYECSATFATKSNLESHENMHNGVRPFCCDQCPCAYTSASALSRHLKKHSDEQYICDHCNTSFKIKAALVAHLYTHEPVPRYECQLCLKRYATKNALNHHVRRLHLNLPMPFACHVCPKRYPRMSLLRDHMKKKHGMTIMTRKMFFKALPTLTEEQLLQAKAILKADEPLINLSADIGHWKYA